jgi:polysaccharide biosynthesis protein PslH
VARHLIIYVGSLRSACALNRAVEGSMSHLKGLYFCIEHPFRMPIHGGKVDVQRRMLALSQLGVDLQVVYWASRLEHERRDEFAQERLRSVSSGSVPILIESDWRARLRRVWASTNQHQVVVARLASPQVFKEVVERAHAHDAQFVWSEGVHGAPLAQKVASHLGVPFYVRSHNIEHHYYRQQSQAAVSWKTKTRMAWGLAGLRRVEFEALRAARRFYDLSIDDLAWWSGQGLTHGQWLPPVVDPDFIAAMLSPLKPDEVHHDAAYVGNLHLPNNVQGLLWFLREALPKVRHAMPGFSMIVAGSKPVAAVELACRECGVELLASPPEIVPVLRSAKVLVNPVFAGSGVNVKSIDMLFSRSALVSTPQGVAGYPESVRAEFDVHTEASAFADAVVSGARGWRAEAGNLKRSQAREVFAPSALKSVAADIAADLSQLTGLRADR